jgi:hypothetical protein
VLVGEKVMHTGFWLGTLKERDHFVDIGVGGGIIFKNGSERYSIGRNWLDSSG